MHSRNGKTNMKKGHAGNYDDGEESCDSSGESQGMQEVNGDGGNEGGDDGEGGPRCVKIVKPELREEGDEG